MKYFVVSDVHSFYDAMMNALNKQGFDPENKEHKLIVCGDLFDRGDDTLKVFEFVRSLAEQDRLIYIYGNHEQLLFECIYDIIQGRVKEYQITNGTFKTICDFTGLNKYDLYMGHNGPLDMEEFKAKILPLMEFIDKYAVDVAEISKYIFVHGWIPCDTWDNHDKPWHQRNRVLKYNQDWRASNEVEWESARWINGINAGYVEKVIEPGKTIVCGHWHCSYGHMLKSIKTDNWITEFEDDACWEPFEAEGTIAIDRCTAHTGEVNVIVLEDDLLDE
jgi:serine/threonine protein phosphatase 1